MTNDEPNHRQFPVRLDIELFNAFYAIFPGQGTRSIFIREAIREAIRQLSKEDGMLDLPDAVKAALSSPALKIRLANCYVKR